MSEHAPSTASATPSRAVLQLRVLLLVLVAGAVVGAWVATRDRGGESRVRYVCPMHAEVTSTTPATCPICGMDLEPVVTSASPAVKSSSYLTYDHARRRAYGPDMPAPAWVEDDGAVTALLYVDELAFRSASERATFFPTETPAQGTEVVASPDAPSPWDSATMRVRFRAYGAGAALRPGDVGWLRRPRSPEPPVVPYSAVLEEEEGPYVLVASPDGHMLARRPIEIGRVFGGVATVLAGLHPTDRVLTGSAFFVDAERRLRGETTIDVEPR